MTLRKMCANFIPLLLTIFINGQFVFLLYSQNPNLIPSRVASLRNHNISEDRTGPFRHQQDKITMLLMIFCNKCFRNPISGTNNNFGFGIILYIQTTCTDFVVDGINLMINTSSATCDVKLNINIPYIIILIMRLKIL